MSSPFVRAAAAAGVAALAAPALQAPTAAQPVSPSLAGRGGAQPAEVGVVRGRVVEAGSQRPVADAQVQVVGTAVGAITNANGEYVLARVPVGARTLRARRIGFGASDRPVTVASGADVRADFALTAAATSLDQVVVTGTAQPTTRRTLGNAITQLGVADIAQRATVTNVTEVLQSRTPGLTLIPGSGTAGTSADIRIRGTSSLAGSNRPIFFIDGVRFYDGGGGNFGPSGAGAGGTFSQGVSALDAINPEDIESIEVIKGPAAATLYGADAAGGVIQIITKKGGRTQGRVNWTGKAEMGGTDWALPTLRNYTTCTQVRADSLIRSGADSGKVLYPGCQGRVGEVISGDPLREGALRTGQYRNYSASARGGLDRFSFFGSGDYVLNEGVFANNSDQRASGRANFTYEASDKLDFGLNGAYLRGRLRLPLSDDAASGILFSSVRGKPGLATYNGLATTNSRGFRSLLPETANTYDNRLESDRFTTGVTANYRPLRWFRNRFTTGLDYYSPLATIYYPPGSLATQTGDYPSGYLAQRTPQTRVITFDYAGSASNRLPFGNQLTSEFTLGAQGIKTRTRSLFAEASGLPSADFRLLQAATTVNATSDYSSQASLGYYAQEQVGYANRLFVTGALRLDNNSAFGSKIRRILYPKASLSYVVSEEPALAGVFRGVRADNVKLRFAYGQAGRAPNPFVALRTYTSSRVVTGSNGVVTALVQSAPGNATLKAERGTEAEYGVDAAFLDNRVGVEFTAYNKRTNDALVPISEAPSTGFTATRFVNFGTIKNKGVELGLTATPVRTRVLTWDARLNYSTNSNRIAKLNQGTITQFTPYNPYVGAYPAQIIKEGAPVASYYAVDVKRKADGSYDLSPAGALQIDSVTRYVGPSLPTHEGAFSNTLTVLKNLRLYALIDFKGGNYLYNQRARSRASAANRNDLRFNDPSRPLTSLDSAYWSNANITAPWIEPADFVKLRDVSVSYTLPPRLLRAVGRGSSGATFTVTAHNLGFLSKKYSGLDPEVNFFGQGTLNFTGASNFSPFVRADSYTIPMTRRVTAALLFTF